MTHQDRLQQPTRVLFVTFEAGIAGPQRWLDDVLRDADFRRAVDAQVWHVEDRYRGIAGKLKLFRECARRLRAHAPTCVYISHDLNVAALTGCFFRILGARNIVVHSHNASYFANPRAWKPTAYRAMVRRACTLRVALSPESAIAMYGDPPGSWTQLADFIDFEGMWHRSADVPALAETPGATHTFACIGRLCDQKHQDLAIEALARLNRTGAQARLLLLGDGPNRGALEQLANSLGIHDKVIFLGNVDNVSPYYRHVIDTLLVPSRYEGQGRIVAEAQLFDVPVIVSPGLPEVAFLGEAGVMRMDGLGVDAWAREMAAIQAAPARPRSARLLEACAHPVLSMKAGVQSLIDVITRETNASQPGLKSVSDTREVPSRSPGLDTAEDCTDGPDASSRGVPDEPAKPARRRRRIALWAYLIRDELIQALQREGFDIVALFQGSSTLVPSYSLHELFYRSPRVAGTSGDNFLRSDGEFLRRYADCVCRLSFIPHTREAWYREIGVIGGDNVVDWAAYHRQTFRNLLSAHEVEEVWFFGSAHLGLDNALEFESRQAGLTTIVFRQSPIPGKFFYSRQPQQTIDAEPIAFSGYSLGAAPPKLFYMPGVLPAPRTGMSQWIERIQFLISSLRGQQKESAWSRLYQALVHREWKFPLLLLDLSSRENREVALRRYLRRARYERLKRGRELLAVTDALGKFVYFPLHYEPEANTSALGGEFTNQLDAVAALHAILPSGWRILIKENPIQEHMFRDLPFYKRLADLNRVHFVGDDADSASLIARASIVATVTGTAGFEALLIGRPCLHFGDAWYQGFPGAFEYSATIDLEEVAKTTIDRASLDRAVNERVSAAADGLVYPRLSALFSEEINWPALLETTARSLARISRHYQSIDTRTEHA